MAVSFLDGKYVKQITESVQNINTALQTISNKDFSSSGSGEGAESELSNNILLERNKLKAAVWSADESDQNRINTNIFDIETNGKYIIWSIPSDLGEDLQIAITIYDADNVTRYSNTFEYTYLNQIFILDNASIGTKMRLSLIKKDENLELNDIIPNVFLGEAIATDPLTNVEKAYLREKIGINIESINELVSGTVKYSESQTLTEDQKSQARANIGLSDINSMIEGTVKYSESQTLTEDQKSQARANIGLDNLDNLVSGTVKYSTEQNLNPDQQSMARDNIGAAQASKVADLELAIDSYSKTVVNVTTNEDKDSIILEYADNTLSEPIQIATGQTIGSISYDDQYQLHILDEEGNDIVSPIVIYGGGGSGTSGGDAKIERVSPSDAASTCVYGESMLISYAFTATDANGEIAGNGRGTWTVNNRVVASNVVVRQGQNDPFDVGEYLIAGENTIRLTVTVDVGAETELRRWKVWTITAANMWIDWPYNDTQINTDAFSDSCIVYGGNNILKTIHTRIDEGSENALVLPEIRTTRSNSTQIITIPLLSHGAHGVRRWMSATIGGSERTTADQYHEMIFVEAGNMTPIIAVSARYINITQYDTVQIPVVVYDPQSITTNVDLYLDNTKISTWANKDRSIEYWAFTASDIGNAEILEYKEKQNDQGETINVPSKWQHNLKIVCRDTAKEIPVTVTALDIGVSEVSGYDFKFKASSFANNGDVQSWSSNGVTASFSSNFDWVNGGLKTETVDEYLSESNTGTLQQYFCVKAGTTMTINHRLFADDVKENGMTFKIIFKVKNCRKYNAEIANCYDETSGVGIRMYSHKAVFSTKSETVDLQYDEDQYTELEFDVYPLSTTDDPNSSTVAHPRYIMGWLDGVIAICRIYGSNSIIQQNINGLSGITIGSPDCDVYVYLVKSYSLLIDTNSNLENHISNYIADAPNAQQMIERYERNDILDDNGEISYVKLADKNRDLRVWLYDVPYMTNDKSDKVGSKDGVRKPTFDQIWRDGSNYYQMHGEGIMSIQGTSSVLYKRGAANTDINFTTLQDGDGNDLLAHGTQDKAYGNNWYYEDDDRPGKAKKFTEVEAKVHAGLMNSYTLEQALSKAQVNSASELGSEWVVLQEDENEQPTLYANANDTPSGNLGPEWVVVERDASRNPVKYIKALGMKLNDDSCPITYSNTKVNFASCEQVNNMCNAKWYQDHTPYPSLANRDCMEFNMGVQFIKDAATGDSSHYSIFDNTDRYNMYSIANMGTSKKNVHIFHDLSNPLEACVEVKDNTDAQMRMTSDDLTLQDWNSSGTEQRGTKCYYEMRYPDTATPDEVITVPENYNDPQGNPITSFTGAWKRLVSWMASRNPYAATNATLDIPETYGNYTFRSTYHDRPGSTVLGGGDVPLTISRYAGIYTADTFERRMARMLSECEDYMVMDSFVYHYVYLTRHTMVDNVSKNNFWSTTDLIHWDLSKAYDMDTSDGNDNQGKLVFDYGIEFDDTREDKPELAFNGGDSVWFRFVANLYEANQLMYQRLEPSGVWSSSAYHAYMTQEQRKIPERCWNQTYWYDYLRTYERRIVGETEWIPFLDGGQKIHQRQHYEKYQELFLSSKYNGNVTKTQYINLFSYAPKEWGGLINNSNGAVMRAAASRTSSIITSIPDNTKVTVTGTTKSTDGTVWKGIKYGGYSGYVQESSVDSIDPKGEITITMYNKMYVGIDAGTVSIPPVKVEGDTPYTITFSNDSTANNMIITVYTASMITKISGIEQLYCNNVVLSAAVRLREIAIGSAEKGYYNQNLESVSFDTNRMLERIEAQNLVNINTGLNLKACQALQYLDATGSTFTNYEFANGGELETAIMESPVIISAQNLTKIQNFTINDYSRLVGLIIENCTDLVNGVTVEKINTLSLVKNAVELTNVRLLGIRWMLDNADELDRMYHMRGYSATGISTSQSVLTGYVNTPTIRQRQIDEFTEAWGTDLYIDLTGTTVVPEYPVRFVDNDGTPLLTTDGYPYVQYIGYGESAYDPIAAGELATLESKQDDQYIYTYSGWDNIPLEVKSAQVVTAVYNQTEREYTVEWYLDDRESLTTLLKTAVVKYGQEALFDENDENHFPTKDSEESLDVYNVFAGWDASTGYIRGNTKVHGKWIRAPLPSTSKKMKDMSIAEIYGIAKARLADTYWTADGHDYIDVKMGRDFDYNQDSVVSRVLCENQYFDGTASSMIRFNDISLFSADSPSFTLLVDYEFADLTADRALAACFNSSTSGNDGFKLEYFNSSPANTYNSSANHGVQIVWGDKKFTIAHGTNRGIVVIRHRKGSTNLQICSDNGGKKLSHSYYYSNDSEAAYRYSYDGYNDEMINVEIPRTQETYTNAVLSFGGVAEKTLGAENLAKGWVYYAKIWYDDLGPTATKQLAYWPHEIIRLHYRGHDLYRLENDTGVRDGASFVSNAALPQFYTPYSSSTSQNSWDQTNLRTFMNERFYKAFPTEWVGIIQQALLYSNGGYNNSNNYVMTADHAYIPARADVATVTESNYVNEGKQIPWFTENKYRIKFMGIIIPEDAQYYIDLADDPTLYTDSVNVKDGDIWIKNNIAYVYVSAENAAKHERLGGREITNSSNITASGVKGGVWIRAYGYCLRTPYNQNNSVNYMYAVTPSGSVGGYWTTLSGSDYSRSIVPMISI